MSKKVKKETKIEYRKTIGILILSFILLGFLVNGINLMQPVDEMMLARIVESENRMMLVLAEYMEWFGSVFGYMAIGVVLLWYGVRKRSYEDVKLYTATAIAVGAINQLLKLYYNRERPVEFFRMDKAGMSFPSGHAMGAMAIYLIMAYIIGRRFPQHRRKAQILSAVIVALMGWSRLYLGVHWPTDILAGYIGGAVVSLVMINIEKRGYKIKD